MPSARGLMEKALGVDRKAWIPEFALERLPSLAPESKPFPARDGERRPGKVAVL
jgi:hypothetical protein